MPASPLQSPRPAQPNFFRPRVYTKQQVEDDAPSVKAGLTVKRVGVFRKQYVNMIHNVCKLLKLNGYVYGTAVSFCHHFYLVRVRTFISMGSARWNQLHRCRGWSRARLTSCTETLSPHAAAQTCSKTLAFQVA